MSKRKSSASRLSLSCRCPAHSPAVYTSRAEFTQRQAAISNRIGAAVYTRRTVSATRIQGWRKMASASTCSNLEKEGELQNSSMDVVITWPTAPSFFVVCHSDVVQQPSKTSSRKFTGLNERYITRKWLAVLQPNFISDVWETIISSSPKICSEVKHISYGMLHCPMKHCSNSCSGLTL